MKQVFVIVGKGYSNYLSCNKAFESKGLAEQWLNSYCNPLKFEVVPLNFHCPFLKAKLTVLSTMTVEDIFGIAL
jgi:hypothetical protein